MTFDTTLTQPKEDLKELKPEEVPFEEQPLDFVINRAEPTLEQEVLEEVAPAGDPFALDPATEKKNTRAKKKKSSEEETQKAREKKRNINQN